MGGGRSWNAHTAITVVSWRATGVDEFARVQAHVYVDVTLRGPGNTINGTPITVAGKDASVWALDLRDLSRHARSTSGYLTFEDSFTLGMKLVRIVNYL